MESRELDYVDFIKSPVGDEKSTLAPSPSFNQTFERSRDLIRLFLRDNEGNSREDCKWTVPRLKLNENTIQKLIKHSPACKLLESNSVVYIKEKISREVVLPEEVKRKCKPLPCEYAIIMKPMTEVRDITQETMQYSGGLVMKFRNMPCHSTDMSREVHADDIESFVKTAIVEYIPIIQEKKKQVEQLEYKLKNSTKITIAALKKSSPSRSAGEENTNKDNLRLRQLEILQANCLSCGQELKHQRRKYIDSIEFTLRADGRTNLAMDQKDWVLEFRGPQKDKYQNLCMVVDWKNLKMVLRRGKSTTASTEGTYKQNHEEYEHVVDLGMIEVARVQDGVGLCVKGGVDEENLDAYEGSFQNGKRNGTGVWRSEFGVYTGEFKNDHVCGQGCLELSSGDVINGSFSIQEQTDKSKIDANPYIQGEPDGDVVINFADGSHYKGEMQRGRITGRGEYHSFTGESYSGEFLDGRYHGHGVWISADKKIVREGSWKEGYLDGACRETVCNKDESFTGQFILGTKEGKGIDNDHGFHRTGFYVNGQNYRFAETSCGANKSFTHEGPWLAERICAGGMMISKKSTLKEAWPTTSGEHYSKRYEPLTEILHKKKHANNEVNAKNVETDVISKAVMKKQIIKNLSRYQLSLTRQYGDMLSHT